MVKKYNKLSFALACATKANELLDHLFGSPLMSKRVIFRCFFFSNGLLIMALSWVGLVEKEPFGVTPWKNYTESAAAIQSIMDSFINKADVTMFIVANFTNAPSFSAITNSLLTSPVEQNPKPILFVTNTFLVQVGTNTCIVTFNGTAHVSLQEIQSIGRGEIYIGYNRFFESSKTNGYTNINQTMASALNPYMELKSNALSVKEYVTEHGSQKDIITYSVFYFAFMFLTNAAIFIMSLIGCRVMLREIVLAARTLSTVGLVFTNLVLSLFVSVALLLIFTVLALPLLWMLAPALYYVANESIYTFCTFLVGGAITLWIMSGTAAKIIALLGLIPSLFAVAIGIFSSLAIKWNKTFHWMFSAALNRFVKNGPIPVALIIITLITTVVALVAKWLHLTAFL